MEPYREAALAAGADGPAPAESLGATSSPEETKVIYQLSRSIHQAYLPLTLLPEGCPLIYRPGVLGVVEVSFNRSQWGLHGSRHLSLVLPFGESPALDFGEARRFERAWRGEEEASREGASRSALPVFAQESKY